MSMLGKEITLDRPRLLRYDFNALADFEEALGGKSFSEAFGERTRLSFAAIRALLWAGLKHEDRRLTLEGTGRLMFDAIHQHGQTLQSLLDAALEAIDSSGVFGPPGTLTNPDGAARPSGPAQESPWPGAAASGSGSTGPS